MPVVNSIDTWAGPITGRRPKLELLSPGQRCDVFRGT